MTFVGQRVQQARQDPQALRGLLAQQDLPDLRDLLVRLALRDLLVRLALRGPMVWTGQRVLRDQQAQQVHQAPPVLLVQQVLLAPQVPRVQPQAHHPIHPPFSLKVVEET